MTGLELRSFRRQQSYYQTVLFLGNNWFPKYHIFVKRVLKPVFIIAIVSVFSLFIVFPNVDADDIDFQYQHKETWKNVGESSPPMLGGIVIDSNDNLYVIDSNQLKKLTNEN